MKFLVVLVASLCALAAGASYRRDDSSSSAEAGPAIYNFAWGVDDSESYVHTTHKESRNGDNTEGEYTIVEPDGSTRKVSYSVNGDSGFVALVNGVRWPQEGPAGRADSGEQRVRYVKVQQPAPAPAPRPRLVQIEQPVVARQQQRVYLVAAPAPAPAPAPTTVLYRQAAPAPAQVRYVVQSSSGGSARSGSGDDRGSGAGAGSGASTVHIQTPSHTVAY